MNRDDRLAELLERWEDASTVDQSYTPEEFCKEAKAHDLLDDFRELLGRVGKLNAIFGEQARTPSPQEIAAELEPGRYQLRDFHAAGGLGFVFVAEDSELRRDVALKCMQSLAAADTLSRRRFVLEAEITGKLEHPGVVPVYGLCKSGDKNPYYAMRFIRGETLGDAIKRFRQSTPADAGERNVELRRLLRHFIAVCETMAYAHSRGVIHRDLKPANIMIGPYGETLVVDWGLAKHLSNGAPGDDAFSPTNAGPDELGASLMGRAKGSPAYMSPEQARGEWNLVGPASDIYSLGSTLFELLIGKRPYEGRNVKEVIDKVQAGQFLRPLIVDPVVPKPLDAICVKAMSLRPEDRYADARDMAKDLERWLADEPVSAWREPFAVRARRWLKRHRTVVTASLAAILVSAIGLGVVAAERDAAFKKERDLSGQLDVKNIALGDTNQKLGESNQQLGETNQKLGEANTKLGETNKTLEITLGKEAQARKDAVIAQGLAQTRAEAEAKARRELEDSLYIDRIALADREWRGNNLVVTDRLLEQCKPGLGRRDLRGWEWYYLARRNQLVGGMSFVAHTEGVSALAIGESGLLITGGHNGDLKAWLPKKGDDTLQPRLLPHKHVREVVCLAFSADGSKLVSVAHPAHPKDKTPGDVRLWDLTDIRTSKNLPYTDVNAAALDFDGKRVALAGEDGRVRVWDIDAKKEVLSRPLHDGNDRDGRASCVAFSRDGKKIAAGGWYGDVKIWNADDGEVLIKERKHHFTTHAIAFSPDGTQVASAGWDNGVKLWDAKTGKDIRTFWGSTEMPRSIYFSDNGRFIVAVGSDRSVRVWNVADGEEIRTFRGHRAPLHAVSFFPRSNVVVAGDLLGQVKFWGMEDDQESRVLRGHIGHVFDVAFSDDGTRIASVGADFKDLSIQVWDPVSGSKIATCLGHEFPPSRAAFSPDGKWVASSSQRFKELPNLKGKILISNAANGKLEHTLGEYDGGGVALTFSPDGNLLVWGGVDKSVHFWDVKNQKELKPWTGHSGNVQLLAFDAKGSRLTAVGKEGSIIEARVWDLADGKEVKTYRRFSIDQYAGAISADRRRLALIGGRAGSAVEIWNVEENRIEKRFPGHTGQIYSAAFSPDDRRLATGSDNGTTKLWDIASERELLMFTHTGNPYRLAFSKAGDMLAVAGGPLVRPGEIRIWDARSLGGSGLFRTAHAVSLSVEP